MIRTAVVGAAGRMGRMLVKEIVNSPALELVGALEYSECPLLGQDAGILAGIAPTGVLLTADREAVASASDVLIDFTFPQVTMPMAELALRFLFSKPEPKSILTGVETVAQLKENIRIAALPPLGEGDLRSVEVIAFPELPEMCVSPYFWPQYKKLHGIQ